MRGPTSRRLGRLWSLAHFRLVCTLLAACVVGSASVRGAAAAGAALYEHWSDGRGEINTYQIAEERYGEVRDGHAILVYVSEELNRHSYVKVESDATPQDQRMYVIKLNALRRFATGIYDYATMTTVFSVADPHLGHPPFQAARVTHSTQEWCGQVFQRMDLREDGWHYLLHSYFESEGDRAEVLPAQGTEVEDNLWVKIRELDQPWMQPGASTTITLVPAAWESRKSHRPVQAQTAILSKAPVADYTCTLGTFAAHRWSWRLDEREVSVWVERDGAHRVLGWEDSRGGRASLIRSERLPYWQMHGNADSGARAGFGLPGDEILSPGQ